MADDEETLGNPLSVEDDEYELVHEVALVVICRLPSLDEARATARYLVEQGLGATVGPVAGSGGTGGFEVRVLPEEAARATELLDLDESDGTGETDDVDRGTATGGAGGSGDAEPAKPPVPWKMLVAIWVAALIIIPLVAFYGTYLLSR